MAAYFITQFRRPRKHRVGQVSKDLKQIGGIYPNQHEAEKALYEIMDRNRVNHIYLRLDRNVSHNPVAYADLDINGGIVRFRKGDGFHFTSAITLTEFKERLAKQEEWNAVLHNELPKATTS